MATAAAPASLRRRATPGDHTAIGALAGVVEVTIMQPTVAMKNALQVGVVVCVCECVRA